MWEGRSLCLCKWGRYPTWNPEFSTWFLPCLISSNSSHSVLTPVHYALSRSLYRAHLQCPLTHESSPHPLPRSKNTDLLTELPLVWLTLYTFYKDARTPQSTECQCAPLVTPKKASMASSCSQNGHMQTLPCLAGHSLSWKVTLS